MEQAHAEHPVDDASEGAGDQLKQQEPPELGPPRPAPDMGVILGQHASNRRAEPHPTLSSR
ncbi:MAG: hypothetical protein RML45_02695 [Acetobacteraceae bacterium]|nr:hypothetical protein [Acetobacteraceae bacterium]